MKIVHIEWNPITHYLNIKYWFFSVDTIYSQVSRYTTVVILGLMIVLRDNN